MRIAVIVLSINANILHTISMLRNNDNLLDKRIVIVYIRLYIIIYDIILLVNVRAASIW